MTAGLAVLCALITIGNIHDPDANLSFVRHVLSMDTLTPESLMVSHGVTIPSYGG
jgi:predicted small integral membrane protein